MKKSQALETLKQYDDSNCIVQIWDVNDVSGKAPFVGSDCYKLLVKLNEVLANAREICFEEITNWADFDYQPILDEIVNG